MVSFLSTSTSKKAILLSASSLTVNCMEGSHFTMLECRGPGFIPLGGKFSLPYLHFFQVVTSITTP